MISVSEEPLDIYVYLEVQYITYPETVGGRVDVAVDREGQLDVAAGVWDVISHDGFSLRVDEANTDHITATCA